MKLRILAATGALCCVLWLTPPTHAQGFSAEPAHCGEVSSLSHRSLKGAKLDTDTARAFYAAVQFRCVWTRSDMSELMDVLQQASEHGLDPNLFHWSLLEPAHQDGGPIGAELDLVLSDAAIKYARIIHRGLAADPPSVEDRPANAHVYGEYIAGLRTALEAGDVGAWLTGLAPQHNAYRNLKAVMMMYQTMAASGGWKRLPPEMAKIRKRSPIFAELRQRLALEGDIASDNGSLAYDGELRQGLRNFQTRNGLRENGVLTAKTVERLNVPVEERMAMVALNLDRLRVNLHELPATRVEVNAPAAIAVLYRDGEPVMEMNVVVGSPGHETPELSSRIESIVLNPPWNIPTSIIEREIKPILKRNRKYLKQSRMSWQGDQLVQEPGAHNALGRIKFDFPNRFAVYLHDTPAKKLFTDPERAASHGCVRLERPLDLAAELLSAQSDWTRDRLERVIAQGQTRRVMLREAMPVVIAYQTAFADDAGRAQFRPDIYGRDARLTLKLAERAGQLMPEPTQW